VHITISPDLWEAHRFVLSDAAALIVYGPVTVQGRAVTLMVERLMDLPLIRRSVPPPQQHGYG
jgi:hypothetical protein